MPKTVSTRRDYLAPTSAFKVPVSPTLVSFYGLFLCVDLIIITIIIIMLLLRCRGHAKKPWVRGGISLNAAFKVAYQ